MSHPENPVAEVPLFARLSREDGLALARRAKRCDFPPGAVIFEQGEPGNSMHVLVRGRVQLTASSRRDDTPLATLGPGEPLGEFAIIDGLPRSATAVAAAPTTTLMVTRETFVDWLKERPQASLAIMESLSHRVRNTNQTLVDVLSLDVEQRLAKQLVTLAKTLPTDGPMRLRTTQSELAGMLGVSRETVNKQLNQFQRQGWLTLSRGSVTIADLAALRKLDT